MINFQLLSLHAQHPSQTYEAARTRFTVDRFFIDVQASERHRQDEREALAAYYQTYGEMPPWNTRETG